MVEQDLRQFVGRQHAQIGRVQAQRSEGRVRRREHRVLATASQRRRHGRIGGVDRGDQRLELSALRIHECGDVNDRWALGPLSFRTGERGARGAYCENDRGKKSV